MPRPRFQKLPLARQVRLIEAAAREFGAHGYQDASINRILERADVSKGAAYYYFDDKEDLFLTVIRHYLAELGLEAALGQLPASVDAETFWSSLTELYRQPFIHSFEYPWAFGLLRAAAELRSQGRYEGEGPLAVFIREQFAVLAALLKRGQELGVIRTDIPDDLLMAWVEAVDDAHDRWLLKHWHELDPEALGAAAERVVDALRRLVGSEAA
jgi:AcrR family transcriptional regulator